VETIELLLSPILSERLKEEDGPNAVDDLEHLAAGRRTPSPEPAPPAPVQFHSSGQSYANRKRAKRRIGNYLEEGRKTKLKKLEEHVLFSQNPMIVDDFDSETLPAANGAYSSHRLQESVENKRKTPEIEELIAQGFKYIPAKDVGDSIK